MAPGREPLHLINGLIDVLLEGVDGAEPLVRGPEDDGAVAAPAVGILVGHVLDAQQMSALLDVLQDDLVGLPHLEAAEGAGLGGEETAVVHRHDYRHLGIVLGADLKVLHAVTGRGVHAAGAAFQRDMVAQDHQALAVQERMLHLHQFQFTALDRLAHDLVAVDLAGLHGALHQGLGHDQIVLPHLDEDVVIVGVQADGHIGGQGPGGGGPDHEPGLVHGDAALCQDAVGVIGDVKAHIDGIALVLAILDLGLGQGGAVLRAPVHRFQAFVDVAFLGHLAENLDLAGLKLRLQGQVGVFEIADDAQALELLAHDVDVFGGELVADLAQLQLGDLALAHQLLHGLQFDGQAVGVVAGHIRRLETAHVLVANDDVLDDLVQGGAHVDVAVGVGRAVVQHIAGLALVVLDQFLVQMVGVPLLEHLRLFFGQTRPHVKQGLGQVDRAVVILWHWYLHSSSE